MERERAKGAFVGETKKISVVVCGTLYCESPQMCGYIETFSARHLNSLQLMQTTLDVAETALNLALILEL